MTRRIQKVGAVVAALAALALGGAVFAQAQSSPSAAHEVTSGPDPDNIQAGDQTTPDTPTTAASSHHAALVSSTSADPAGGGTGQSGDQTAPDTGSVSETVAEPAVSETAAETAPGNDGPGGHADEPGSPNADHQFSGTE